MGRVMNEQAEAGAVERLTTRAERFRRVGEYGITLTAREANELAADLRTLLSDLARMKAALELALPILCEVAGTDDPDEIPEDKPLCAAIRAARLALRQHEDGK